MAESMIIALIVIFVCILVGVIVFDSNRFVIREYTIFSNKIEKDHNFLFLSDQHCREYGPANKKVFDSIKNINAEACFIAGDMLTAVPGAETERASSFVIGLNKLMPVFYSYGNHEYRAREYKKTYGSMFDEYMAKLSENGIKIYDNEKVSYEEIDIYSLTINKEFYKRFKTPLMKEDDVSALIGTVNKNRFSVLLAHNPQHFEAYSEWNADLILSGHIHGGIVRIPGFKGVLSPNLTFFPKYDGGRFERNDSTMIVNRGLGMHSIPFRLFNPAEIVLLHIKKY